MFAPAGYILMCVLFFCLCPSFFVHSSTLFFFFNDTATTEIYTLSLHDALPIFQILVPGFDWEGMNIDSMSSVLVEIATLEYLEDRKSTRLNSSHLGISYAVFCLKKKKIEGFRARVTCIKKDTLIIRDRNYIAYT